MKDWIHQNNREIEKIISPDFNERTLVPFKKANFFNITREFDRFHTPSKKIKRFLTWDFIVNDKEYFYHISVKENLSLTETVLNEVMERDIKPLQIEEQIGMIKRGERMLRSLKIIEEDHYLTMFDYFSKISNRSLKTFQEFHSWYFITSKECPIEQYYREEEKTLMAQHRNYPVSEKKTIKQNTPTIVKETSHINQGITYKKCPECGEYHNSDYYRCAVCNDFDASNDPSF